MKRSLGAALLSGGAVIATVPSLASGASVVNCQTRVYPGANTPVFATSARGLTCKVASSRTELGHTGALMSPGRELARRVELAPRELRGLLRRRGIA
jgi:hypothetical protein